MQVDLFLTEDGSSSLYLPELDEYYHSVHGAIQEARHVYIEAAMNLCKNSNVSVFEVGFGTGLNALLSAIEAERMGINLRYFSIDSNMLSYSTIENLNYTKILGGLSEEIFYYIHNAPLNVETRITPNFSIIKINEDLLKYNHVERYNVIYFDAFAPNKQHELWREPVFESLYEKLYPQGILTTYCAKGSVRRMMQNVGFHVERIPGPPGKREMLRATRRF